MKDVILAIMCVILPILIFYKTLKFEKQMTIKVFFKVNIYQILVIVIMILGFLVRVIALEQFPNGLNVDEASAGYESYSLLNYGIDRRGNSWPVHLVAWGSGQNVLYSYIMMPAVQIFGLTVFSVRLPMAIIGCISIILMYALLKKFTNKKLALLGIFFLSICPWHIMKSRWGLESNLFPDMILLAITMLVFGIKYKNKILYYFSFVILGLSAYSYGTSYLFLPFFLIAILILLLRKNKINIKKAILSGGISFIIAIPLIIFVVINTFDFEPLKLGFITIPRLTANRYQEIASVFSKEFITVSLNNFINSIKILILQSDELPWNALNFYGITYIFSLPFTVIGIVKMFLNKSKDDNIFKNILNIWFIICIILLFVCDSNINRINIIMFPIMIYTIFGIYSIIDNKNNKINITSIVIVYIISFVMFINQYINTDFSKCYVFESDIEEMIQYVQNLDVDKVYITNKIKEPYIYTLFYTKANVNEFIYTVDYATQNDNFNQVKSFGKYYFYIPETLENNANNAYVLKIEDDMQLDENKWKKQYTNKFIIVTNK